MPQSLAACLLFRNASQVLTLAGPPVPRRGPDMRDLEIIQNGAVLTSGSKIVSAGRTRDLLSEARRLKAREIDCHKRVVVPGFVDCHTHLVFAGDRVAEYEQRIRGKPYEQIAREGGGIGVTSQALRKASAPRLTAQSNRFLEEFAAHGTTTLEVKSGYGLDVRNELKSLEVVKRLRRSSDLDIVPTLLAAHALPPEYQRRREAYLQRVVTRLIPSVARRKLATFIDCFCDREAFSLDECRIVLRAGARAGLIPRIHAEQLSRTGGCRLAIELGAASADHLDHITGADIHALAKSDVAAILLPGPNFHLGLGPYPPARRLIDAGAAVALATDFNPGTSPTVNMQFVLSLACSALHFTPAEAFSAATINAAYSLRLSHLLGSIEPGKQADLVVMDVNDFREIPYYFGWNHCVLTVKRGRIRFSRIPGLAPDCPSA